MRGGPLLKSGVEIHEYSPTMLHCKMLIFDNFMVSVGSTNFDMRSFELNDEASLNMYDAQFARRMTEVFEDGPQGLRHHYDYLRWQERTVDGKNGRGSLSFQSNPSFEAEYRPAMDRSPT